MNVASIGGGEGESKKTYFLSDCQIVFANREFAYHYCGQVISPSKGYIKQIIPVARQLRALRHRDIVTGAPGEPCAKINRR